MITQFNAPKNRENQATRGLIALSLATGVFLLYAVQNHLVTDAFIACLSLLFDKFSVKSTGIFPDLALLALAALLANGTYALIKNHLILVISGAVFATVAAIVWGA